MHLVQVFPFHYVLCENVFCEDLLDFDEHERYLRDFMNEWNFSRKFGFNSAVIENPKKV